MQLMLNNNWKDLSGQGVNVSPARFVMGDVFPYSWSDFQQGENVLK